MPNEDKKKKLDGKKDINTSTSTQLTQQQTETATELLVKYSILLNGFIEMRDGLDELINVISTQPSPR